MNECIKNLEKNGFSVIVLEDKQKALEFAKTQIKDGLKIGLGGSTTVAQIGLLDYLVSLKNITLFNQYEKGISHEENIRRRKEGILSDLYICSVNAITKKGELLNVDGSGNRVAAQIFGPKKLLLFVGVNKIVDDIHEAIKRIQEVAIPKNLERLNKVAASYGKELYTKDTIANKYSFINGDDEKRTTIVLIKEELGY